MLSAHPVSGSDLLELEAVLLGGLGVRERLHHQRQIVRLTLAFIAQRNHLELSYNLLKEEDHVNIC